MQSLIASVIALVLTAVPAAAQEYRRFNIFTGGAYREKQEAPDRWRVMGNGDSTQAGQAAALYRAAQLAARAGSPAFRIVKQKVLLTITTHRLSRKTTVNETARLWIKVVRNPADLASCEMPLASQCMTMSVENVMARFGPQLNQLARPATALPELAFAVPHLSFKPLRAAPPRMPAGVFAAVPARVPPAPVPLPVAVPRQTVFEPTPVPIREDAAVVGTMAFRPLPPPPVVKPLPGPPAFTPLPR